MLCFGKKSEAHDEALVHGIEAAKAPGGDELHALDGEGVHNDLFQPQGAGLVVAVGDDDLGIGGILHLGHELDHAFEGVGWK